MTATVDVGMIDQHVDKLISMQVQRTPEHIAVICDEEHLTYRELDDRCSAAAQYLWSRGIARGDLVGVFCERSIDMLVAIIAVMKAGAAYVPLDPEFPEERLAYMLKDSGSRFLITHKAVRDIAPSGEFEIIEIDRDLGNPEPSARLETAQSGGNDPVYVIYTSGSTGHPKGVILEHRNVVNFLFSMQQEPGLSPDDTFLAVTTLSFDIAVLELFLPLITGASLVIAERDDVVDGSRLKELIVRHGVNVMQATPTSWRLLMEAGWQGGSHFKALCGGEAMPADLARQLASSVGQLWNMYGPTETAVWSSCYRVPPSGAPILIGTPIANTGIYILDKAGRPAPVGVPGEIFIGGAGVARGYLNQDDLTIDRFVHDPFIKELGGRMYRTGDFGRYLPDGNLEYRERNDTQVKVRGFRIELGEVESALASCPGVKQAIGRVAEVRPGDSRLVAYVQMAETDGVMANTLREHLRERLPQYMIPQHFIPVETFPTTPNGKIDRRQLPDLQETGLLKENYIAPASSMEKIVASVFADVLQRERVSADASFFDLGGHSILATRAAAQLRKACNGDMPLRLLFEHPSVAELARQLETAGAKVADQDSVEELVF